MTQEPPENKQRIDKETIVLYVAGDRSAYERIFETLKGDIYHIVRNYFFSPFDQDDAFQEVWLNLYRMRGQFDVNRSREFIGWTRRVARNKCIDILRKKGRKQEVSVEKETGESPSTQKQALFATKLKQVLQTLLGKMSKEEETFFQLCFVEEYSHEEIAGQLGISVRRSKYLKKKLMKVLMNKKSIKEMRQDLCILEN